MVAAGDDLKTCGGCHRAQTEHFGGSAMVQALTRADNSTILAKHNRLEFASGAYRYSIVRRDGKSFYAVTDGTQTMEAPLQWAFGNNSMGQTYTYEWEGEMYQSRVSFYRETSSLDFTLGALSTVPRTLKEAAGLKMSRDEKEQCFGCHATGVNVASLDGLTPGVQCGRCHEGTAQHAASLTTKGGGAAVRMKSLKGMSAEDTANFCGQCHRTWADIASSPGLGVGNVRFQPYRLTNSKCFDVDDPRVACTACHNPHEPLRHASEKVNAAFYDARCVTCHGGGKPEARRCTVGTENCASCHMPKVELPGSHHRFTDHQIRIARADGKYPE